MIDATVRAGAAVEFGSARAAGRRVAGLPVAARMAREWALAGFSEGWLGLRPGEALDANVQAEIHRLAPGLAVHPDHPPAETAVARFPADRLIPAPAIADFLAGRPHASTPLDGPEATAAILRTTGKATDGVVSRWINRPISRRMSALMLLTPGTRPIHATIGTAAIAVAMALSLVFGGREGLLLGAILFQCASIFDGVDGEIARATFRTSPRGAALDSAIDAATNVAAMLGLAVNLALRGHRAALELIAWALALFLIGLTMIGRRSFRETGSVSFDGIKHSYRDRFSGQTAMRLMTLATLGTSRDFCALVYLALVVLGIPMAGLYLFAVVTPVWLMFVAAALRSPSAPATPGHA